MSTTMKWLLAGAFIVLLYYLKVPMVVTFIDGNLKVVFTAWNYLLDVFMNVKLRHPWEWMSLPLWLFLLMSPAARK